MIMNNNLEKIGQDSAPWLMLVLKVFIASKS